MQFKSQQREREREKRQKERAKDLFSSRGSATKENKMDERINVSIVTDSVRTGEENCNVVWKHGFNL